MPVAFEGAPDELAGLTMFLEEQRAAQLRKLDGLTDAQAASHPTVSDFCTLTLVKHAAFVEIRAFYEGVIAENREILADVTDLDGLSANGLNRRWVLLHLIEETARHAGHADLVREALDGSKGG